MGQQVGFALQQSAHRVLVVLASFLPGVVASLLALLLFTLLGIGLSSLLRRLLTTLRFDERLAQRERHDTAANIADWSPARSPSLLIARGTLWLCIFVGIAVGVTAFDASYASSSAVTSFVLPYLTHITGAILLLLIGTFMARFLERSVLIGAVNAQLHYARFLSLGVKWLVLVLTAAMVLDHLHIGGTVIELAFGILFGGIVLTLSLAVGLGSRDFVSRSIERGIEKTVDPTVSVGNRDTEPASTLRHF
jgi:hypothetical protein